MESRYYSNSRNDIPAHIYIASLPSPKTINKIIFEMELLEEHGISYMMRDRRKVRKINNDPHIYELKVQYAGEAHRILFTIKSGLLWYLSGFTKKSDKTPKNEFDLAIDRAKKIN